MQKLQSHSSNPSSDFEVHVDYRIQEKQVIVQFDVKATTSNVSTEYCDESLSNIGLWNHDVVEVFIQKKSELNHYLELQVSPLSQKFALLVKEPRKSTDPVDYIQSEISSVVNESGFSAKFLIHTSDIPGDSDEIYANFFSCLGPKDDRSYFALNINTETEPDYHRPDLFKYIGSL
jgi:hypothetical protein